MLVMPFELTNAPANFQSFIQSILTDLINITCVVYLDDILIYSKSQESHDLSVHQVLERLRGAELYKNPKKCKFDRDSVEYLGYIISENGIQINPKKLNTILDWPVPTSIKEIQQFLGFCNFNQRFIHKYSKIAMPLQDLMHVSDDPFPNPLLPQVLRYFEALKLAFTSPPVLQPFNPLLPSTIITNASDFAMAGIHLQPDNSGLLYPCSFYSRKWSPAEINYDTHNKELLAIIDCFRDM